MPLGGEVLSDLIGEVYGCALAPGRWPGVLEALGGHFGACSGAIYDRGADGVSYHCEWGAVSGSRQEFAARHMQRSPLLTMGWHFEEGAPITLASFMRPEELRRTEFYRTWLAPRGWFDFVGVILAKSASRLSMAMFLRPEGAAAPGEREVQLMRLLALHLRRALEIQGALSAATTQAGNLAAALDALPSPVLLLDAEGGCVEANAAGRRLAASPGVARMVSRALLPEGGAVGQPGSHGIAAPDGRRFVAHVVPLEGALRHQMAGPPQARWAVFMQEMGEVRPLPGEVLVRLYGLTPAETRLLGLIGQGLSVAKAAESLGITMPTARTHMRNLFGKTGTHRQAELVRLTLGALPRAATMGGERPG